MDLFHWKILNLIHRKISVKFGPFHGENYEHFRHEMVQVLACFHCEMFKYSKILDLFHHKMTRIVNLIIVIYQEIVRFRGFFHREMINKIRAISHWQFWILFILKWSKFWRLFIMKLSKFHCEKGPKKECNHKIVIISRWIWFKILEISRQKQSKSCNEKLTKIFFQIWVT